MKSFDEAISEFMDVLLSCHPGGMRPNDFFTGKDYGAFRNEILEKAINKNLIEWMGAHIRLTGKGIEIMQEYGNYTNYSNIEKTQTQNVVIQHNEIHGDNATVNQSSGNNVSKINLVTQKAKQPSKKLINKIIIPLIIGILWLLFLQLYYSK